jgi:hypothetical protein
MARDFILEVKADELAKRHDEPGVDLCAFCGDRFEDWLKSGRQSAVDGLAAIHGGWAVSSTVAAGR